MDSIEKRLLLQTLLIGVTYMRQRNISLTRIALMQEQRAAEGKELTIDDLIEIEEAAQHAIDSIQVDDQ